MKKPRKKPPKRSKNADHHTKMVKAAEIMRRYARTLAALADS